MKYRIDVFPEHEIALFHMCGHVTVKEAKQCFLEYVAHPEFHPNYVMLTDARGVTEIDGTYRDILFGVMGLVAPLRRFKKQALSVVLVDSDLAFGMGHILQQVLDSVSPIRMRLTEDEATALALMGRTEETFDALHATLGQTSKMSFSDLALAQN